MAVHWKQKPIYFQLENKATIAAKIVGMAQYIVMPRDPINGRDNSGSHLNNSGARKSRRRGEGTSAKAEGQGRPVATAAHYPHDNVGNEPLIQWIAQRSKKKLFGVYNMLWHFFFIHLKQCNRHHDIPNFQSEKINLPLFLTHAVIIQPVKSCLPPGLLFSAKPNDKLLSDSFYITAGNCLNCLLHS